MIDFACKTFDLDEIIKCSLGLTKAEYRLFSFMLKNNEDWMNTSQLSKKTSLSLSTMQRCMKTLHEKDVVERRQENLGGGGYTYIYKAREKDHIRKIISEIIKNWSSKVEKELRAW